MRKNIGNSAALSKEKYLKTILQLNQILLYVNKYLQLIYPPQAIKKIKFLRTMAKPQTANHF